MDINLCPKLFNDRVKLKSNRELSISLNTIPTLQTIQFSNHASELQHTNYVEFRSISISCSRADARGLGRRSNRRCPKRPFSRPRASAVAASRRRAPLYPSDARVTCRASWVPLSAMPVGSARRCRPERHVPRARRDPSPQCCTPAATPPAPPPAPRASPFACILVESGLHVDRD